MPWDSPYQPDWAERQATEEVMRLAAAGVRPSTVLLALGHDWPGHLAPTWADAKLALAVAARRMGPWPRQPQSRGSALGDRSRRRVGAAAE